MTRSDLQTQEWCKITAIAEGSIHEHRHGNDPCQTDNGRYEQRYHKSPISNSKSSSIGGLPYSLIS